MQTLFTVRTRVTSSFRVRVLFRAILVYIILNRVFYFPINILTNPKLLLIGCICMLNM